MSIVLITGASTGIGSLTARALVESGHTVCASMRGIDRRNAVHARELLDARGTNHFHNPSFASDQAVADVVSLLRQTGALG